MLTGLLLLQLATTPLPAGAEPPVVAVAHTAFRDAAPSREVMALRADLHGMIRGSGLRNDRWGVMVASLDAGDVLYAYDADMPLVPASNMKLFTTAAALYYLGPDYRFATYLVASGPIRNGVLEGDLVVYGTGDPTLSGRFGSRMTAFQAFADSVAALGIRQIRGDVIGDASYFDGPDTPDGWQQSYMNSSYAASSSALSFSENIATLEIRPAAQAGWRPEVRLVPGGDGIAIVNQAVTVARGATTVRAVRSAYDGPIIISGQIAANAAPVSRMVPLADPPRYAAAVLRQELAERGIIVHGFVRAVTRPEESVVTGRSVFAPTYDNGPPVRVLAVHSSPPLLEIVDVVNRRSHNLLAEQTLRAVGRVAVGEGSIEAGARALRHMLESAGDNGGALPERIADGSGLSVLNRASAHSFIALLSRMPQSAEWQAYWSTLPEAGDPRGLRRMQGTPAAQNLRAKTGTISNVSALSGYVRAANGELLAFSILANNVSSTWAAKRIEDAIGARLAEFDRPRGAPPHAAPADPAAATPAPAAPSEAAAAARDAAPEARHHTVRSGDTLDGIARQYGTTVAALQSANPGLDPRRLQIGQRITLP